ncbi:hypothetical protein BDA96_01G321400 [Sorghum bicolor]|uniref:Uncharacterized protein n=2 Tax=Sorghum bicolor TaxID=4558 RepID=A0A921V212_SORBI|nr:hypothetical protein BDA96_01G321400 [Sorghum bicolor]KXG38910.1 hypothetical protein SORBI_3001G297300 [Sorghum bicolor]
MADTPFSSRWPGPGRLPMGVKGFLSCGEAVVVRLWMRPHHPPLRFRWPGQGQLWCSSRLLLRSRAALWCCGPRGEAVIARVRGKSSAWLGQVNDGGASDVTFSLGSVVSEPSSALPDSRRKPCLRSL